ncbi:nucleotidyltransferase domain-containing protein [Bacillus sp. USDA818B3_A]|uniref:nucleotidyltransferase domain-containing protein n=1 Tax=Bacillus sp. USDA818B3_A TaxID=2698834 RepID=UPI00136C1181|nr:nucleotidyltransferase family protein [Bacillus sp. USDA818B3_A]
MENINALQEMDDFSRELLLLFFIVKNNDTPLSKELFTDVNWDLFLQYVEHHRLYPIVYKTLKQVNSSTIPYYVMNTLSSWYKKNTFQMLLLNAEMEQVSILFSQRGIKALFLKGPVLAYDLYLDLTMRTSKDLDILVKIEDLEHVNQLLLNHGYVRDDYTRTVLDDWKWKNHHIEYAHPQKGISLEIHWRLHPGPGKEPTFLELWKRKRISPINHKPVYFLNREDLFVYLIAHGARHGWFRLRWLTDLNQMIKQDLNWREVNDLLKKFNYQHLGGQVFILLSRLLGTPIPVEMKPFSLGKRSINLAKKVMPFINQLENLHSENLPGEILLSFNKYLYELMTLKQKCFYYYGFLFPVPEDTEILALPKKLHFLYFPLRPFLWIWKKNIRAER